MSSGTSAALALGLGVAGGAAIWYFTRDKKKSSGDKPDAAGTTSTEASTAPSTATGVAPSTAAPPPRVAGPCSLKLDKLGLTADGQPVSVAVAVERCKAAGSVEWMVMPDAPGAVAVELNNALTAAKLPITMKK